jgi:DNA invertase Pin-like site-specific DNA recombinase
MRKGAFMARISKGQLEKLQKKYKTDEAIGKLFGISRQAVHQLRTKYGIDFVAEKHAERNDEIIKMYQQGVSGTRLAKKFKLSISQAYRVINTKKNKKSKKR